MAELEYSNWDFKCESYAECFSNAKTQLEQYIADKSSVKVGITYDLDERSSSSDYEDYDGLKGIFRGSQNKRDWVIQMEKDLIEAFIDKLDNIASGGGGSMPEDADSFFVYVVYKT